MPPFPLALHAAVKVQQLKACRATQINTIRPFFLKAQDRYMKMSKVGFRLPPPPPGTHTSQLLERVSDLCLLQCSTLDSQIWILCLHLQREAMDPCRIDAMPTKRGTRYLSC